MFRSIGWLRRKMIISSQIKFFCSNFLTNFLYWFLDTVTLLLKHPSYVTSRNSAGNLTTEVRVGSIDAEWTTEHACFDGIPIECVARLYKALTGFHWDNPCISLIRLVTRGGHAHPVLDTRIKFLHLQDILFILRSGSEIKSWIKKKKPVDWKSVAIYWKSFEKISAKFWIWNVLKRFWKNYF